MSELPPAATAATVVAGESLVDVVDRSALGDAEPQRHPGGSPLNVAVGLARLGHPVRLVTRIGDDDDGALVRRHLEPDGVALAPGSLVHGRTATATAVLDATGQAQYTFDLDGWLPPVDLAGAGHLHTGSIGAALPPGAATVRTAVLAAAGAGATTSYDPNLRPAIIGPAEQERPGVEALVAAVDVVKASDEDLAWLYPGEDVEAVLRRWATAGPALVVVTRGGDGALAALGAAHPDGVVVRAVAPRRVDVVDTVGAGDAFMAGLVSGLLDAGLLGSPAARAALRAAAADAVLPALRRATWTSSVVCGRAGAQPPTRAELAADPDGA